MIPDTATEREAGLAGNSLWQLVGVRFKEYTREPEALFWSFGFPILLAIGLGIAFRSKPPDIVHVAVARTGPASTALREGLQRDHALAVEDLLPDSAEAALRTGRVALVVLGHRRTFRSSTSTTTRGPTRALRGCSSTMRRSGCPAETIRSRRRSDTFRSAARAISISSFPVCSE